METVCQLSYPLTSENASPFGTRTVYLAWPVSCADVALLPRTARTETASETTTITTAGILLLFIATLLFLRPTAAELIRVKRHELPDARRRPAGHLLHAVRQPVIPTPELTGCPGDEDGSTRPRARPSVRGPRPSHAIIT